MQPPVAEPATLGRQLADRRANRRIVGPPARIADRRPVEFECLARPPLAHLVRRAHMSNGLPSSSGRHHFRLFTSFRIALSSIASASSFLSFAFSSSSDFKRLASDTSRPPNFAFHLMGWTALPP